MPESEQPCAGRLWTRDFIVGTLVNFVLMVNYYMLMVVMTTYAMDAYAAPASLAAFCASIFIIGTLVARFASGAIVERFGRKRILVTGACFEILFSCLYLSGAALPVLFAIRLLHGIAYGMCSTAITTVVTSLVPHERKGEGVGYYMLSVTLGSAVGPSIGIFVSTSFDFRLLFVLAAATAAAALLGALTLRVPKEGAQGAGAAAAGAAAAAAGAKPGAQSAGADETRGAAAIASRVLELPVLPISLVCGLVFFGYSSLLTFLTPYAASLGLVQAASFFFVVYALIMFVTRPFTGRTFDRRGPRCVMVPAFLSFALGMVVLGLAHAGWMILLAALFLGFGVGTVQSSGLAMAVRATPDARLSLANSTFYICLDIGVGIGPVILGMLAPAVGYESLFLIMAAVAMVALGLFFLVERRKA
ncbi:MULTISPECIES: MFS transporter [unclassified Adlercreutzia]|uniref:MFS transporter n=1 Tax=unclassified Adlercreutzia TaxID=2636013 RepID=UPI0013EB2CC8|nr:MULTISPECIES: MFS transporter [unclassified Adlercreutzia]